MKIYLKHQAICEAASEVAVLILSTPKFYEMDKVIIGAVPRGGIPCLYLLMRHLPGKYEMSDDLSECHVIIDDIVDSGTTKNNIIEKYPNAEFHAFFENLNGWVVFPYEGSLEKSVDEDILRICQYHEIDPKSENFARFKTNILNKELMCG